MKRYLRENNIVVTHQVLCRVWDSGRTVMPVVDDLGERHAFVLWDGRWIPLQREPVTDQYFFEDDITVLSDRDRDQFLQDIDNPPPAADKLLLAAADYLMARTTGQRGREGEAR